MPRSPTQLCLAICLRFNILGLAVISATDIIEVKRRCLYHAGPDKTQQVFATSAIRKMVANYGVSAIVVEPGSKPTRWCKSLSLATIDWTVTQAKQTLLPGQDAISQPQLLQHVVDCQPKLRNIATILPATGKVAMTQRWRIAPLLAVSLGLSATRTGQHLINH